MTSAFKKTINQDEYLKALGLFTLAHESYRKSCEYSAALNRIIMEKPENFPGGHVDDCIFSTGPSSAVDFSEALAGDGVTVELGKIND